MALKDIFKKKDKPNVSVWFLFIASAVILIFFLWYFLIYVSSNEKLLIQKSFRVLTQIGQNFKGREASLRGLAKSKDMDSSLVRCWRNFEEANINIKTLYSNIEIDKDSLDKDYFYFSENYKLIRDKLFIEPKKNIFFKISKNDFFKPIERKDVFDEIIIIKENPKSNPNSIYEFIYSSFPGDLDVKKLDSLIATDKGLSAGILKDIELSGIEYMLFITKIQLLNNDSYYIGGIIFKENYVTQTRSINAYVAILLLIIFFIFLFSIPLIKLKMISENLQLKITDLSLSGLSIIFGTFFTLLIILSLFSRYQREENISESLAELSNSIRDTLITEIKQIDTTLNKFIDVVHKRKITNDDIEIKMVDSTATDSSYFHDSLYYSSFKDYPYKYFKLMFDLDSTGQQIVQTSSRKKPLSTWSNYNFRTYFRESGEWKLDSLQIMLDFIVSKTSGENLGVVSKRGNNFVFVITSRLYSVINTILPQGYGFCVIDKKGDVKFHSNSERMLQENFIEETENSSELKQAIYGNLNTHFSAKYAGKNNLCYVQPVNSLPLYLVTFYDQSYLNSVILKITNLTFIFSSLLLLMFFLIVIGSRVVLHKRTELKRNLDFLDWLKPHKGRIEKFRKIYIANILAIALIITASIISNPENVILIIFLFVITQIVTSYCYMHFITWDNFIKNYLIGILFPLVIIISVLIYFAFNNLPLSYIYQIFVFNFLLIGSNFIVIRISANIFSGFKDQTHFYLYLYSWITLIVITPVFIFFITFYNHETKSDIAHNLYTYAKEEAVRNYDIDKFYDEYVQMPFADYKESQKIKGVYFLKGIGRSDSTEFYTLEKDSIEETLDQILFYLKPDFDNVSSERKSLVKKLPGFTKYSTDSVLIKYPASVFIKYTTEQIYKPKTNSFNVAYYKGEIDTFGFTKSVTWISFIVIMLFFCYIFFRLLKFVSDKISSSSIESSFRKELFRDIISEYLNSNNDLMIQFSGPYEKKTYDNKKDEEKYFSATNSTIIKYANLQPQYTGSSKGSQNRIIIEDIHLDFENPQDICEKLSIINDLAEDDNIQLILMLECSFSKILDDNEQMIELEKDEERIKLLKNLQKILNSMDNNFVHLFPHLTDEKFIAEDEKEIEKKPLLEKLKAVIQDELSVSDYLKWRYEQSIENYAAKIVEAGVLNPREKIILKIQEYATGYYESIWETCSNSERILLYDISDDLLLNDKNKKVIRILLIKGLLKYSKYIDIMNKSFRNFIVAKFESDYKEEYMRKYESSSNWAKYRAPILLIVLALAFFIALQQDILSNITSILPAIIAALGLITKVSGIFSKGSAVQSSITQSN